MKNGVPIMLPVAVIPISPAPRSIFAIPPPLALPARAAGCPPGPSPPSASPALLPSCPAAGRASR